MARISAYEFDYNGKHYRWDRSTLRSPEGRAEIQRVLTARVAELAPLGYQGPVADVTTAKHVLEALALPNGGGEAIFRAIEEDIADKLDIAERLNAAQEEQTEVAIQPTNETVPGIEPLREMNRIASTPEGRIALQRAKVGLSLDAQQQRLVDMYQGLEKTWNDAAKPTYTGGTMKVNPRPALGADVMPWLSNPHKEQRRQLSADWKNRTLANPDHDYWHPERGALNKSAKLAMKAAYEMAETGEVHSVQVNPADGSISEGE